MVETIYCIILIKKEIMLNSRGIHKVRASDMVDLGDSEMVIKSHSKFGFVAALLLSTLFITSTPGIAEETKAADPDSKSEKAADMPAVQLRETEKDDAIQKPAGPGIGKAADTPAADIQETDKGYVIQAGDILNISVWRENDLQKDVAVHPDGGINFPLAGQIIATGKTIYQLQNELATKLAKFVPDPMVTVSIRQVQGNKIYIIGKVSRPGEIVTNRNIDVMQALSAVGGPTPFASVNKIKILRRDQNGEMKSIPFRYSSVEKGKDLEQNIILRGGDIVIVP